MKAKFLLAAKHELEDAMRAYNTQLKGLGDDFRDEAFETVTRIKEFPSAWALLGGNIRRCQMRHFPYGIVYEIFGDEIVIIAVAHLHRRPEYWKMRAI